jgi:magnesium transporter
MVKAARSTPSLFEDEWPTLSTADRAARFAELPPDKAEGLYRSLDAGSKVDLLLRLSPEQRRLWMRTLAPDDAADCLQAAPEPVRDELISHLDPRTRSEVAALLAYADDEAGGLMNPRYAAVRPEMRVDDALAYLRRQALERVGTLYYAYVQDPAGRLRGVVSVRELFAAAADKTVAEVMTDDVVSVSEGTDQEEVGRLLAKHDLVALPVVDILDVVSEEATEDIQRLGGLRPLPDAYLRTSLAGMIWRRGGWLAALFLGEMLTTSAMGRYQDDIGRSVTLALFVPLIISSGGNSGSQATTLVIRAMALGELKLRHWRRVLSRELLAGASLGLVLGVIGLSRIAAWQALFGSYGEQAHQLAMIVAVSLVGVVIWGAVAGAMLPFALRAIGLDPASASAPLVATVVGVTGIVIYFTVARAVLGGVAV